ncbi:MAG: sigma 54-interacting transcriptional regulator [Desulfobacteraceae bacterium]|nr:sigma 54-interacting transcriptional regulator [Desulfobacteraceae bacterium]
MNPFTSPPIATGLFRDGTNIKKLLDTLDHPVIILDNDLNVIFFNARTRAISDIPPEKAVGIPCRYFLKSRHCNHECPLKNSETKIEKKFIETDILNSSRQIVQVKISFSAIYDSSGNQQGYILSVKEPEKGKNSTKTQGEDLSFSSIIGKSPQMDKVYRLLPVLAQSDASILITGETGTGKDLLAEELHRASERSEGPFIKVNCGALPETLLESELFGHTKGAFTGAVENKPGRFKLAHNGTLFLTEIGDLPLTLQVKLLTFLDDKVVYPLGSTKGFQANVRMIAATHRDLEQMVREGRFRQDLLFRLNVARLHLPPLRERDDDVFLLLNHFLKKFNEVLNKKISGFTSEAKTTLLSYTYPGNVREVRNIMEYAANVCQESKITPQDLPAYIQHRAKTPDETPAKNNETIKHYETQIPEQKETKIETPPDFSSFPQIEKKLITDALFKAGGNKSKAADILGWGRTTLWRKMKKYEIG